MDSQEKVVEVGPTRSTGEGRLFAISTLVLLLVFGGWLAWLCQ